MALAVVMVGSFFAGPSIAQTPFTNATAITITDCPNPCPASGQAASLYPSPITVSGVVGVVQRVSVTLNGLSHGFPADIDILLVSPSGRKSVLMSDFGAGAPGVSNINVTLDDYAQRPIPSTVVGNTGTPFVTGTYRPANNGTTDQFPGPAPSVPYTYTLSAFNGENPNGTWSLYIIDDANLDGGSISGGWTLSFDVRPPAPAAGDILISEFRTRGVGTAPPTSDGAADEFIELYNNTNSPITIIDSVPGADPTSPNGAGWRLSVAHGGTETGFHMLAQTSSTAGPLSIPPRGNFLVSVQPTTPSPAGNTYSLATYPSGTGITPSGQANLTINPTNAVTGFLPDDAGLAIFSTATATSSARLDSVGFSAVTSADHKEGAGLTPANGITTASNHSWTRRFVSGVPKETGDNSADFMLVDPTGDVIDSVNAILGAPGPERGPTMTAFSTSGAPSFDPSGTAATMERIDPAQPATAAPNLVRDSAAVTNGANGTLKIRRKYTNNSGKALTALRFRVVALSTRTGGAAPAGRADLRVLNSSVQTIALTDSTTVTTTALTLQTPPAQSLGGGVNSSLAASAITTTAPLANGASIVVEFNFGVETDGPYEIEIRGEGLAGDGIGGINLVERFDTLIQGTGGAGGAAGTGGMGGAGGTPGTGGMGGFPGTGGIPCTFPCGAGGTIGGFGGSGGTAGTGGTGGTGGAMGTGGTGGTPACTTGNNIEACGTVTGTGDGAGKSATVTDAKGGTVNLSLMGDSGTAQIVYVRRVSNAGTPPSGLAFSNGVFDYRVTGLPANGTGSIQVKLTLPAGSTTPTAIYKCNNGTCSPIQAGLLLVNGNEVTVTLQDNGPLDANPTNGVIDDPIAPAFTTSSSGTGGGFPPVAGGGGTSSGGTSSGTTGGTTSGTTGGTTSGTSGGTTTTTSSGGCALGTPGSDNSLQWLALLALLGFIARRRQGY